MKIDDVNPLVERFVLLSGGAVLHYPLKGVGRLAHSRDNDHEIVRPFQANDMLEVTDTCCVLHRCSTELKNFHSITISLYKFAIRMAV